MALFWKKHTEPVPVMALPDDESKADTPALSSNDEGVNNKRPAEQNVSMNDLRREFAIGQARSQRLSADELQQVREQIRLAQTRLESVQDELDKLAENVRQHNAYVDLSVLHQEVQQKLYEQNKIMAALKADEQRLMRFELCEDAMPLYLTLQVNDSMHQQYRAEMSRKKEQARQARSAADADIARVEAARAQVRESALALAQREDALQTGFRIDGEREAMAAEEKALNTLKASLLEARARYKAQLDECRERLKQNEELIASLLKSFTPLDSNRAAKESVGAILVYLDNMHHLLLRKDGLSNEQRRLAARQRDLNDRLGDLFMQDQKLEESIGSLQGEIAMHRDVNHGIDGQSLQLRVMSLRARKQDLMAAQRMWGQICSVWQSLDEKRNAMRAMQLESERSDDTISKLTVKVRTLATDAEQRRHDYTLSKGQNVIRLRGDLREGVACSVCGATTHPFHSDTILEQNKLINEWKQEADRLDMELRQTREQLLKEQLANASRQGVMAVQSDTIEQLSNRLREYTRMWDEYASLDTSLHGCNPASMADARTQTIRGLIETCQRDETMAMEQLNTYNYHQQAINRIAESIDAADNERAELHTALSETNTGCQVLAHQAELMRNEAKTIESEYQEIYKRLDDMIQISDWHQKWLQSHDNFKVRLRTDAAEWNRYKTEIEQKRLFAERTQNSIDALETTTNDIDAVLALVDVRLTAISDIDKQALNLYNRLFADQTASSMYAAARSTAQKNIDAWEDAIKQAFESMSLSSRMQGISEEAISNEANLADTVGGARATLDDWMYQFRLDGNPPCRFEELYELFGHDNDWKSMRNRIREARREYDITELHETELRGKLLAAQQGVNAQQSSSRREALLKQRHEILMNIAQLEQRIKAHEHALQQLELLE